MDKPILIQVPKVPWWFQEVAPQSSCKRKWTHSDNSINQPKPENNWTPPCSTQRRRSNPRHKLQDVNVPGKYFNLKEMRSQWHLPGHLPGQRGHLSFISCFQGDGSVKSLSLTLTLSSATLIHNYQYDTEAHLGVVCLGLHKTRKCAVYSFILLIFNYLETKEWLCVWCPFLRVRSAASSGWNSIWMHNVGGTKGSVVMWLLWGLLGLRNIMHDPMLVNLKLYWLLDAESSVSKSVTPTSHKGGDSFIRKYHCPFFRWKNIIHLPASGWPVSLRAGTISVLVFIISHSRTQVSHVLLCLLP